MAGKAHLLEPEAFELYRAGMDLKDIAKTVGVSIQTLSGKKGWKTKFKWDSKLDAYSKSSRKSIDILDRIIREKLEQVESTPVNELPKGFEDGLFKLQLMREKMNARQDRRQQTIDVMDDLNAFLNAYHPDLVQTFHDLLPEFLTEQGHRYGE